MAEYLTNDTDLKKVADAIRAKGSTSDNLVFPDGYVSAIENIPAGGGSDDVLNSILDRSISGEYVNDSLTSIGDYAFGSCPALTSIDLPAATSIGRNSFFSNKNLTSVNLPAATSIGSHAFYSCSGLTSVNLPAATSIGDNAFSNCQALTSVNLPAATSIKYNCFSNCYALANINLPLLEQLNSGIFQTCEALTSIDLPAVTSIGSLAFSVCSKLTTVILRITSRCVELRYANVFNNTPIKSGTGYIYVPSALVESYKSATNWSTYADQIRAIEDYPDITGG